MEDKLSNFQPLHYTMLTCVVNHFQPKRLAKKFGVLKIAYKIIPE